MTYFIIHMYCVVLVTLFLSMTVFSSVPSIVLPTPYVTQLLVVTVSAITSVISFVPRGRLL